MRKPKLIKFWAEWCIPCHRTEPIFAALEKEFSDRVNFWRVNVDEEDRYAMSMGISTVPTLLLVNPDTNEVIADLTPWASQKTELRSRLVNALEG